MAFSNDYSQIVQDDNTRYPREYHLGSVHFHHTVSLVTGDLDLNDEVILYKFPADVDCWLDVPSVFLASGDLDSGTAIVSSIGLGDADGTQDVTFATGLTLGRAAGDNISLANVSITAAQATQRFYPVKGKYLIWKVTTIPTGAQAGSLVVSGAYVFSPGITTGE